ncbi:MAG TPA: AMP-binding protein [Bryobacteraceae bacterium]|jgi:phenylacetate-CoA ligase|nr:AMP-binding protein [Bryobacteraceae bacterium]
MLHKLYAALPVALQHACATAQGAKYHHWRYSGVFQDYLATLKRTEYLPAEQLHELQAIQLARLRRFAATHVPHYRKHGPAAFTAKDQIRERPEDFLADTFPLRALIPWHTSGTTGKPLTVYHSRQAMQKMWAFVELYRNTAGVTKNDRRAQFTGKMIVPARQSESTKTFWRRDLANHALLLSTVHLLPGNLPFYAAALEHFRPVYLSGYPSAMYMLAEYYWQSGRPAPQLRAALTSAETLLEHQRRAIEETFATPVFDQYGQAEMQSFWYACEAGRMHAHPLAGLTEILRADGTPAAPGEMGEVVLTGLVNYAMPLIRYRVGDTARFATEKCPCGRGMPVIEEIGGRLDDFVYTRERGFLGRLDPVLKGVRNIVESQLEQESLDVLRVRFVPAPRFTGEDLQMLENNLRARVGRNIHLEFECTDRIPRSSNGKFRFVISRLDRNVPKSCVSSRG